MSVSRGTLLVGRAGGSGVRGYSLTLVKFHGLAKIQNRHAAWCPVPPPSQESKHRAASAREPRVTAARSFHMACPGEDDLSGVALDPPNVLENVDAAMGLTGTGAVLAI